MSDKESDTDQQCQAKRRKSDVTENKNQNEASLAGPSNVETSADIFKMNIDCFEELFDWLSLGDLFDLRVTCKRFKKIVDYYFKVNYPRIGKFKLNNNHLDMFRQMDSGTIGWIREIEVLVGHDFDVNQFSSIEKILNNVKNIIIKRWKTDSNIYNCFLKYCKNLKCLSIKRTNIFSSIDISSEWLSHQYPSIEYLRIDNILKSEINDFVQFFHLNPNIHAVSIDLQCLNNIGSHLFEAGIKFDRFYTTEYFTEEEHLDSLKQHYDIGFYKRLCLNTNYVRTETENSHSKLALIGTEVLGVRDLTFKIPSLPNLKELNINSMFDFDEKYKHMNNIVERFNCLSINSNVFLTFIGKFPKLKHFKFFHLEDTNKLNLIAMNKERQKLPGACKTIIYVPDELFLTTKWAMTKTNFNLIELKRYEACDWDQFFENDCKVCRP